MFESERAWERPRQVRRKFTVNVARLAEASLAYAAVVNEAQRWTEFGNFLRAQREKVGLNRRQAARRAKVAETLWRDLEAGYTTSYGGVRVLPNPGPDVLEQIAGALEITTEDLTRHVGRITNRSKPITEVNRRGASALPQKVARLGDRDRRLVESLVDQMLELE